MAVQLETEFCKSRLLQLFIYNVQRGELLGNEENLFAVAEAFSNNICNRLALTCAGRSLKNKACTCLGHFNCFDLAGVCINNIMKLHKLVFDIKGVSIIRVFVKINRFTK